MCACVLAVVFRHTYEHVLISVTPPSLRESVVKNALFHCVCLYVYVRTCVCVCECKSRLSKCMRVVCSPTVFSVFRIDKTKSYCYKDGRSIQLMDMTVFHCITTV